MLFTRRTSLPSSISRRAPGCSAAKISGCGRPTRDALPISDERSKTKLRRRPHHASSTGPTGCFGPCRSARIQTGCPVSSSSARMAPIRLACSPCVPCEIQAEHIDTCPRNARNASGVPLSVLWRRRFAARGSAGTWLDFPKADNEVSAGRGCGQFRTRPLKSKAHACCTRHPSRASSHRIKNHP